MRSAVTAENESGSFNAPTSSLISVSSVLVMMPRAPCPGAGSQDVRSSHSSARRASPRRVRPAPAKMMASNCPSSSFRSLVSTLPRMVRGVTSRRNAFNRATRRSELVPTMAPSFSEANVVDAPSGPTRTSRGSTRVGVAAIHRPSGNTVGRSLSEWTVRWTRPSRSASSSSRVKMPLPLISWRGWSRCSSPTVRMTSSETSDAPLVFSADAVQLLWAKASSEPRVPNFRTVIQRLRAWSEIGRVIRGSDPVFDRKVTRSEVEHQIGSEQRRSPAAPPPHRPHRKGVLRVLVHNRIIRAISSPPASSVRKTARDSGRAPGWRAP